MIQAVQVIDEITRSNILNLFPEYDIAYEYTVEPIENATFRSTVRIGNYIYHSTADNNLGNHPLSNLGRFWIKGDVSNIYAMLDFENITRTQWDTDGVVEFERGNATVLALAGMEAGCVKLDMLEPKHGVLTGLALTGNTIARTLISGSFYSENHYYNYTSNWSIGRSDLPPSKDNYIYPSPIREATVWGAYNHMIADKETSLTYVTSSGNFSIIDTSNPSDMYEVSGITITDITQTKGIHKIDNYVYITHLDGDIITIDVSDKYNPKEVGLFTLPVGEDIYSSTASDDALYISARNGSDDRNLYSMAVTTPAELSVIDVELLPAGRAYGVDISVNDTKTTVFVQGTTNYIVSVNVTDNSAMAVLTELNTAVAGTGLDMTLDGTDLYFSSVGYITSVNVTNPSAMAVLDTLTLTISEAKTKITVDSGVLYLLHHSYLTTIDVTNTSSLSEISNYVDYTINEDVGDGLYILNNTCYGVANKMISFDVTDSNDVSRTSLYPSLLPTVISVPIGDPTPITPTGTVLTWKIVTDASLYMTSVEDLRDFIDDAHIDGLTQTRTFYNEGKGATLFELPELGAIARVTFKQANNAGASCGTMIAGEGINMGKTLNNVSFTQTPIGDEYIDTADLVTSVDKRDFTLLAHKAKQAINQDALFIIDPSVDSEFQKMMLLAQIIDVPYSARSIPTQRLGLKIRGEELVNEIPLYVYDVAFFIAGVTETLEVYKGCGNMSFTRSVTATYIDEYGNTKTAQIDEPRFQDGMLMSAGGEVCWYDAVESIPTFENGFTFEWEGIATGLSSTNSLKTYIMSNDDVQLYFRNEFLYFYLNGSTLVYALPTLNTRIKVEIRAESNGDVTMVIDDVEVTTASMDISDVTSSLTYIGSHNGESNTSGVLLQTASHKWYNTPLDNPITTIPIEVWVNESVVVWVDELANQWTTG